MKKSLFLFLLCATVCVASAQDKMRVWVGGKAAEYPVSVVDSVTFLLSETPVEPDIPDPDPTPTPAGGLGVFSVAEGKTVAFASGNLQYNAVQGSHLRADGTKARGTWRFAEHQYDYIGEANKNISETYDGWIDLFGWGTSGYDNTANDECAFRFQPWSSATSSIFSVPKDSMLNCETVEITGECEWEYTYYDGSYNVYGYGPSTNMPDKDLTGTSAYYDWGVYNAISNAGNEAGLWRTLTIDEWIYLLNTRTNAQYLWSQATVNGVYGMIILPDNYKKPASITWTPKAGDWTTNTYTVDEWQLLEDLGSVFLPASGYRRGSDVYYVQYDGGYWSATYYYRDTENAYYLRFDSDGASTGSHGRYDGYAVRLVQDL